MKDLYGGRCSKPPVCCFTPNTEQQCEPISYVFRTKYPSLCRKLNNASSSPQPIPSPDCAMKIKYITSNRKWPFFFGSRTAAQQTERPRDCVRNPGYSNRFFPSSNRSGCFSDPLNILFDVYRRHFHRNFRSCVWIWAITWIEYRG